MKRKRTAALVFVGGLLLVAAALAAAKKQIDLQTLSVGMTAPAFTLPDQDGKTHTLADDQGKVVLLAFYPADFTGGCTIEAHSLSAADKDLAALGVSVYGVSVQDTKSHKAFCTKEGIPYTLLADTKKEAARAYGVLIPVPGIANRVTYIIGKDGKIVYVDKDVNGHLQTCGDDWAAWLKAHPEVTGNSRTQATAKLTALVTPQAASFPARPMMAALNQPAPDFTLPDVITGAQTSLAALEKGKKATVVMFIATRCPVSNGYNDRIVALAKYYAAKGVAFAGINANTTEPVAECADHAKQHGFPFPVLKDANDTVADAYDAHVTPEIYVIDAQGTLVYHGRIDNSLDPAGVTTHDLANALDDVLAGKPVAKPRTKAFGCSIKR